MYNLAQFVHEYPYLGIGLTSHGFLVYQFHEIVIGFSKEITLILEEC